MRSSKRRATQRRVSGVFWAVFAVFSVALGLTAAAQDNSDCLACHEDAALEVIRVGRKISVHVDARRLAGSTHADLYCTDCHQDLSGVELPHPDDVAPADCSTCHSAESAAHAASLHGKTAARGDKLAPTCVDCPARHDVLPRTNPAAPTATMNIPLLCGKCHREGSPVTRTHEIDEENPLESYRHRAAPGRTSLSGTRHQVQDL